MYPFLSLSLSSLHPQFRNYNPGSGFNSDNDSSRIRIDLWPASLSLSAPQCNSGLLLLLFFSIPLIHDQEKPYLRSETEGDREGKRLSDLCYLTSLDDSDKVIPSQSLVSLCVRLVRSDWLEEFGLFKNRNKYRDSIPVSSNTSRLHSPGGLRH